MSDAAPSAPGAPASSAPGAPAPAPAGIRPQVAWPVVAAFGAWSVAVWVVRLRNIWDDVLLTMESKTVLSVVALVFVGLGTGTVFVGLALRRWFPDRADVVGVGVLAVWTVAVWGVRVVDIAFAGDHEVPFIVVHVLLAVGSVALAAWAWQVVGAARAQEPVAPPPEAPAEALAGSVPAVPRR